VIPGGALRSDVPGGDGSAAMVLSRLPEVPSVLAPLPALPSTSRVAKRPGGPTSAEPKSPAKGSFGTLASPIASPVADPPAHVVVVPPSPLGGTLPSKDRPSRPSRPSRYSARRGLAPAFVALLVACGLLAGFLLGLAVGRAS
jgi:hypothetical protein